MLNSSKTASKKSSDFMAGSRSPHGLQPLSLEKAVERHSAFERVSFHTPGHKGRLITESSKALQTNLWQNDVTELPGLDDLSRPTGVLAGIEERAAQLWKSKHAILSVNGASGGLIAAILAVAHRGTDILVPRNAHRSIISGLVLSGLTPVWYEPVWDTSWGLYGPVTAKFTNQILASLNTKDLAAMVVVSPTYAGALSDIAAIAGHCHQHNVPLIVDEAHGAHAVPGSGLPKSAIESGADIIVHSIHKTLSSLTQVGLIHLTEHSKRYVEPDQVRACLNAVQTSSPSYILMSSTEQAIAFAESEEGSHKIRQLHDLNSRINRIPEIEIYHTRFADDVAHILIAPKKGTAQDLFDFLIEKGIFPEAILGAGVLLLLGIGSESMDIVHLTDAINEYTASGKPGPAAGQFGEISRPAPRFTEIEQVLSPRQAFLMPSNTVPLEEANGRIAAECIAPCPPGIPVCVPGQKLTDCTLELLTDSRTIRVVSENILDN